MLICLRNSEYVFSEIHLNFFGGEIVLKKNYEISFSGNFFWDDFFCETFLRILVVKIIFFENIFVGKFF